MEKNKKLSLEPNKPTKVTFLSKKTGTSTYGEWFLYNLRNGDGTTEYSYFAPPEVHEKLKDLKKGTEVVITKLAANRNGKIAISYAVEVKSEPQVSNTKNTPKQPNTNPYLENMLASFEDAMKVQEHFNGLANVTQLAITIYISRNKASGLAT